MENNENKSVWFLSRTINRYLGNNLYLIMKAKKQRKEQNMKGSFYHDKPESPQKIKGYYIPEDIDNIDAVSPYNEIGQFVLYEDEVYIYIKNKGYKKILVAE